MKLKEPFMGFIIAHGHIVFHIAIFILTFSVPESIYIENLKLTKE
jgi:hypothetical protein